MADPQYDSLIESYREQFREHGYSPKSLGWLKGKQDLRFETLTKDWNLEGKKILDVGCGFGDFVKFLNNRGVSNFSYVGVDVVDEFIEVGKREYEKNGVSFLKGSIEEVDLPSGLDLGIASGAFNQRSDVTDCYEMVENILRKMFDSCQIGIAVDFLTDRVDYRHEHNFNYSPEKILAIAYSLSRRVSLSNTTFPFEFSVTIYRDDSFNSATTIFNSFELSQAQLKREVK
ncbi:MAG: class I SAM-dependent methyltransferase [Verrucomicrobiales bacterium]|nr:class I SAM-dependent methyltransferase [Verrucomicrobiales bacterium]